jgi:hypothetical protein
MLNVIAIVSSQFIGSLEELRDVLRDGAAEEMYCPVPKGGSAELHLTTSSSTNVQLLSPLLDPHEPVLLTIFVHAYHVLARVSDKDERLERSGKRVQNHFGLNEGQIALFFGSVYKDEHVRV